MTLLTKLREKIEASRRLYKVARPYNNDYITVIDNNPDIDAALATLDKLDLYIARRLLEIGKMSVTSATAWGGDQELRNILYLEDK